MFHLANKLYLLALILVPALYLWHRIVEKRGQRFIIFSSKSLVLDADRSERPAVPPSSKATRFGKDD